jgi:hypothetical protein
VRCWWCYVVDRFSCCDLDGDGALSPEEMRHFYRSQVARVTSLVRYLIWILMAVVVVIACQVSLGALPHIKQIVTDVLHACVYV